MYICELEDSIKKTFPLPHCEGQILCNRRGGGMINFFLKLAETLHIQFRQTKECLYTCNMTPDGCVLREQWLPSTIHRNPQGAATEVTKLKIITINSLRSDSSILSVPSEFYAVTVCAFCAVLSK
jgi:hypothetical protein